MKISAVTWPIVCLPTLARSPVLSADVLSKETKKFCVGLNCATRQLDVA
jgi:hypothetical protein